MSKPVRTAIAQGATKQCTATPPWFVQDSEYHVLPASFELLINGEEAFRAVHEAIAAAKKSVSIICWGFQPSMYFIRDGKAPPIGQLLEQKASKGVKVRVLCWALKPLGYNLNVTGFSESNTPGRWGGVKDKPVTSTGKQYLEDKRWYELYDEDRFQMAICGMPVRLGNPTKAWRAGDDAAARNLHFRSRGFPRNTRIDILTAHFDDEKIGMLTRGLLAGAPSHHQKMVLVDYEDPANHVGFVMGHNMLDEYWDTSAHSYKKCDDPSKGRNGSRPRQDFSSRVTGPIVGDLFNNFALAWQKETGQTLPKPDFANYPLNSRSSAETEAELNRLGELASFDDPARIMGQILRTQPQHKRTDIKACYLQAINNATQYIYLENQYFRWPELAEKIRACAAGQIQCGRKPETHGPLYLFAITNADNEGMGPGIKKTQRMLESLGRSDVLPEVTKLERADDARARLGQTRLELQQLEQRQRLLPPLARTRPNTPLGKEYADNAQRIEALKAKEKAQAEEAKARADKDDVVAIQNRPGLKVHICTLVAPDTPGRSGSTASNEKDRALTRAERTRRAKDNLTAAEARLQKYRDERYALDNKAAQLQGAGATAAITRDYEALNARYAPQLAARESAYRELKALEDGSNPIDWVDVYIHAKLMLIDDTFMTLGSANINNRSMYTDSELNIAHDRHKITQPARRTLWGLHTNGRSGGEAMGREGMKSAYENWQYVIKRNKDAHYANQAPVASLVEFYSGTPDRTDLD